MQVNWIKHLMDVMTASKTFMTAFIASVAVVSIVEHDVFAQKKTVEFGLIFVSILFGCYLVLSGLLWIGALVWSGFKRLIIHQQKNFSIVQKLSVITDEERAILEILTNIGKPRGVIDLPDEAENAVTHLKRLGLIDVDYIERVGAYRQHRRYRFEIHNSIFKALRKATKKNRP